MHELLQPAYEGGYAVPSFCAWNAEVAETILQVATDLKAPVILMSGPGEFGLNSPDTLARICGAIASKYPVPVALHLDHGDSLETVKDCLDAGFSSVMLDFSLRSFDENVAGMKQTIAMARPLGVTIEGEIGAVGKVDDVTVEGGKHSTLTDPAQAAHFVEETGVDCLAVSIGNAHGIYTKLPVFDCERLEKIRKAIGIELNHTVALGVFYQVREHRCSSLVRDGAPEQGGQFVPIENVVAEHKGNGFIPDKLLADDERLGQPLGSRRHGISQPDSPLRPVPQ